MHSQLEVIDVAASRASQPLCEAVFNCLSQSEKSLPCRFFYDEVGSDLFEQITQLPEYYLTRCEAEILQDRAEEIVAKAGENLLLVEFGSGSSVKTRLIIEAALKSQSSLHYVPIDISRQFLVDSAKALLDSYAGLSITAISAEYLDAVEHLPDHDGPRLILFLGSNLGNFSDPEAIQFLTALSAVLRPGDHLLVGTDLVKDDQVLFAAYNDSKGITAEFNRNLLRRINRELQANFDPDLFEHHAPFVSSNSRIEMRLIAKSDHSVFIQDLETEFRFTEGEIVTTEFSHKYTHESLQRLAEAAGLAIECRWTDSKGYFAEFMLGSVRSEANRKLELKHKLSDVRERTLALLGEVPDDFLRRRVHDFYSPIGWHFGHVGRTEEYWVCQATGKQPLDAELSFIYADLSENPKDNRVNIPDRAGTITYLEKTRQFVFEALDRANLQTENPYLKDGYAWEFAIQHECQHHETIAEMLHLIRRSLPASGIAPIKWESNLKGQMISHPTGAFVMGDSNLHFYDNEKDPHEVRVEEFELAEYPVTSFEWSEFIEDGGYQRAELWSEIGWQWVGDQQASAPFYWQSLDHGIVQWGAFGLRALHPDEPVMGISHFEAEAYAAWKGFRLPTEAEWEYASSAAGSASKRAYPWGDDAPDQAKACHTLLNWSPRPVTESQGRTPLGVSDLAGNVWEWTSSQFLPYPNFRAFPYDGYSKDHMKGAHFVCRGGSWATSPIILRNTFRNWYVPSYRQGFLGVRLANG